MQSAQICCARSVTAAYSLHQCNILLSSLQHTLQITATLPLHRCSIHLELMLGAAGAKMQHNALRTCCYTPLPSLQHTTYITATYLVSVELHRKALFFVAFLNTTYINATYLFHDCNVSLSSLQHTTYPLTSQQRPFGNKRIYSLSFSKNWGKCR